MPATTKNGLFKAAAQRLADRRAARQQAASQKRRDRVAAKWILWADNGPGRALTHSRRLVLNARLCYALAGL